MRLISLALTVLLSVLAQERTVKVSTLWADTVKRGTLERSVRALGVAGARRTVELRVAETQSAAVRRGLNAEIDARDKTTLHGKVTRIETSPRNGTIGVTIALDPSTRALSPGTQVDGMIHIETVRDVIVVGRPVFGRENAAVTLFKLDPDGRHATRVPVRIGRSSVNQVEILSGLEPGDKVILSDMHAYDGQSRIALQ